MQLRKYLLILVILPLISVSGCSLFKPKEVIVTKYIYPNVVLANKVKPVTLNDVYFNVVVNDNYDIFKNKIIKENGELVFIAIDIKAYENMSLNVGELRRYIEQQKSVIQYYEDSLNSFKEKNKL